jgi:putative nucleotidyltransferase with HDIG domain
MRAAATAPTDLIDVDSVRVGMFIHLDMGWMSHPFPLSSFKVTSAQQVATLRSLGLKRVRWSPQQSDSVAPAPVAANECLAPGDLAEADPGNAAVRAAMASSAAAVAAAAAATDAAATDAATSPDASPPASGSAGAASADAAARSVPPDPAAARREALAAQRAAQQLCERQFAEAARACRQVTDAVLMKPQEARQQAEALTRALTEKIVNQEEVCIRLLTEAAGDKVSMHAVNVAVISLLMGRAFGFSEGDLVDLGTGALLHDIGKLEMPLRLRHRDESFTASEQRDYEEHVAQGLALARRMGLSPGATLVVAQHHEHADGTGFPLHLNSDRMTPAARIVALVNRYDNLCNPYFLAKAVTPHEALSQLFAQGKTKYETSILSSFIKMMGVYPPGSTVQLTDDRYAIVVAVNSSRPLKPRVLIHEPGLAREDALVLDLEHAAALGIRRSLRPSQLPPPAMEFLAPRQRVAYFFEPADATEALA